MALEINKHNLPELVVVNAYDIYNKKLSPTKWYVGDLLHEGACLLSGDPKVGKSFLALQIAIAVAGTADTVCGSLKVGEHGRVLYLAVDDGSEKRIHERLHQLTDDEEAVRNIDFVYQRTLPSLSCGLDTILDDYLSKHKYVLVVLDTLGAVLDVATGNKNLYRNDYQEAITLQKLAQKHGICLLILHHTNKSQQVDTIYRASGTHGLTGAVDSVLLLSNHTNEHGDSPRLYASPRDGEKAEHGLRRLENGSWEVSGYVPCVYEPKSRPLNPERNAVKKALAAGPKDKQQISAELSIAEDTARKRLERMKDDQLLKKLADGRYEWIAKEPVSPSPPTGLGFGFPGQSLSEQ